MTYQKRMKYGEEGKGEESLNIRKVEFKDEKKRKKEKGWRKCVVS